jgi:titin
MTVNGCSFSANTSTEYGGGAIENFGSLSVANSTLFGNTAATNGGGIENTLGTLTISDTTITANSAEFGAGISVGTGTTSASLQNSTVVGNYLTGNISSASDIGGNLTVANTTNNLIGSGPSNSGSLNTNNMLNPSTYTVTTTASNGSGSLYGAINSGKRVIEFDIPTTDPNYNSTTHVFTIQPTSNDLLVLSASQFINGLSQPGAAATGYPVLELDGVNAGPSANGLTLATSNCTVEDLAVSDFAVDGIASYGNDDTIVGNYVGTDPTGTTPLPNKYGIVILTGGKNNIIGGTGVGEGNLASGNSSLGVYITGSGITGNMIEGNLIGTNVSGLMSLANDGDGIFIDAGASNNTIGGTAAGASNVISGNS